MIKVSENAENQAAELRNISIFWVNPQTPFTILATFPVQYLL
jgi:hypothetical protein